MKLTKRQLRKLISESILNEMPMIKPGGGMDPSHLEKLTDMVDTEDEASMRQADELASMVGHDSENFSQDLKRYDRMSIMGAVGEFAHYLTDKDMQILMNIAGKDLHYGLYSWAGFGFSIIKDSEGNTSEGVSPDNFYEMQHRIAAKKKDIDEDDIAEHEGMDTGVEAAHDLAVAIMRLSKQTQVHMYTLGDAGIGEARTTPRGIAIDFWEPEYEQLYNVGKLAVTG